MSWIRPRLLLSASLALALLGAACTQRVAEPTTLSVVLTDDWVRAPAVVDAVRSFEAANPDVRVDLQGPIIENINAMVGSAIERGDPPDVVQQHAFVAAALGLAEPLDDLWETRLTTSEFLPGAVQDVTWQGRRWGVPLDTNALVLLVNLDHAREAGLDIPLRFDTFDDLRRAAAKLTTRDGKRRAIAIPSSTWAASAWIKANGGDLNMVNDDGSARFTFDSAENIQTVRFLAELIADGYAYAPIGRRGDRVDAFELLRSGAASIHATGSWDLAALERENRGDEFGIALMPKGATGTTSGTVMGGSSMYVPKGSANRELAFAFMTHLIEDGTALRLAKEEGRLPVRPRMYEDPFFATPVMQVFFEQLRSATPFTLEPFTEAHNAFEEALIAALQGEQDARDAMRAAQRDAERGG